MFGEDNPGFLISSLLSWLFAPVSGSVLQFSCRWKSFIHITRCTELRQRPHFTVSCFGQGFLVLLHKIQLCSRPQTLPQHKNVTQVQARQEGFLVVLRFLENGFIFTALWFCQQANTCHDTVFLVFFSSKRKKTISQQTYLLCGAKEKLQNGGQNWSLLLHKGLKEYMGDVLHKFSSRRWSAFM